MCSLRLNSVIQASIKIPWARVKQSMVTEMLSRLLLNR